MMIEVTSAVGRLGLPEIIKRTYEILDPFVAEGFEIKDVLFTDYKNIRVTVGVQKPLCTFEPFYVVLPVSDIACGDAPEFMTILLRELTVGMPDAVRMRCSDVFDTWAVEAGRPPRAELIACQYPTINTNTNQGELKMNTNGDSQQQ
jgi:hypothetical protein